MVGNTLSTGSIQLCGTTTGSPKSRVFGLTRHGHCPDGVAHAMQLLASRSTGMQIWGHFSLLGWVDRTLKNQISYRIIVLCGLR